MLWEVSFGLDMSVLSPSLPKIFSIFSAFFFFFFSPGARCRCPSRRPPAVSCPQVRTSRRGNARSHLTAHLQPRHTMSRLNASTAHVVHCSCRSSVRSSCEASENGTLTQSHQQNQICCADRTKAYPISRIYCYIKQLARTFRC